MRAVVGTYELDSFLTDKDEVAQAIEDVVRRRASDLGLEIVSIGIRDVILPGDMRNLMNKVTEAKKAAESNLIARREETAAMRSQAHRGVLRQGIPSGQCPDLRNRGTEIPGAAGDYPVTTSLDFVQGSQEVLPVSPPGPFGHRCHPDWVSPQLGRPAHQHATSVREPG